MPAITKSSSKSKHPPYPRPVPEISVHELAPRPVDDFYYFGLDESFGAGVGFEGGDDAEDDAARRAAKRQRIEENAYAYLRGQQLCIMTARLRGPFEERWKNPWARKKQVCPSDVPVHDSHGIGDHAMDKTVKSWLRTNGTFTEVPPAQASQDSPTPAMHAEAKVQAPRLPEGHEPETESMDVNADEAKARLQQLTHNLNSVVEESDLKPAPVASDATNQPPSNIHNSSRAEFAILNAKRGLPSKGVGTNFPSPVEPRMVLRRSPRKAGSRPVQAQTGHNDNNTPHVNGQDGEVDLAVPQAQSGHEQHVQHAQQELNVTNAIGADATVAGPGTVAEHIEQDDADDEQRQAKMVEALKAPLQRDMQGLAMPEKPSDNVLISLNAVPDPAPSMVTSELVTGDMLPSAQHPPPLQPSMSSGLLEFQMLNADDVPISENPVSSVDKPQNHQWHCSSRHEDETPVRAEVRYDETHKDSLDERRAVEQDQSTPIARFQLDQPGSPKVQQQIIPHFNFNSFQGSKPDTGHRQDPQLAASVSKPDKKRKKASFRAGSNSPKNSQALLKNAWKVKVGKSFGSPPQCSSKWGQVDSEDFDEENATADKMLRLSTVNGSQNTGPRSSKGILKNTNTINSQRSPSQVRTKYSSSQQQDGQGNKLFMCSIDQMGTTEDDAFDLEEAIGDLGSFLGSWDTEKEASGITE